MSEESAEEIERGVLGAILLSAEEDSDYARQLLGKCRRRGVSEKWFSAGNSRLLR